MPAYILIADETNQRPNTHTLFFIYGAIFLPIEALPALHELVQQARDANGFRERDELKFDTHSKPPHVSVEQHREAKRAVLAGCRQLGVRFIAYLTLHEIARRRQPEEVISWGANTVLGAFNHFLGLENASGICVFDRFPFDRGFQYLKEKFEVGMMFPRGGRRRLDRIHLFSVSAVGAGHAMSAIDIVLGAFRYCVNERGRREVPRAMLPVIVGMMWNRQIGDTRYFREYGLLLRPRRVEVPAHRRQYEELAVHLRGLLEEAASQPDC